MIASKDLIGVVFDTETTGFSDPTRIVEAAYIGLDSTFGQLGEFVSRYNPGRPIDLGAKATHHILESELVDCPSSDTFMLPPNAQYLIGHNIDYDWSAIGKPEFNLEGAPIRRICTLALAREHLPDLDSHNQSAMLYHILGDSARPLLKEAHSALQDVQNCLILVDYFLNKLRIQGLDHLWELSEQARIPKKMTWGKHDGTAIEALPRDYKNWLLRQEWLDEKWPYHRKAILATM